jgi:3',5'-cyclic AMP phosphodiesterase CpdA
VLVAGLVWIVLGCRDGAAEPLPVPVGPVPASAERIVAVGDLHGDVAQALAVLAMAGITDAEGRWIAGNTVFVQTGDVTDRGDDSRAVLALLRRLDGEAKAEGGLVVPLLGNHEVMNVRGDWRYVSPGDLAAYGGEEARRAALSAAGEDGAWLRSLDTVALIGDTVFVHGGIHPRWADDGYRPLNEAVRAAMDDPAKEPPVLAEDGPLWFRGYVQDDEATACPLLDRALAELRARRMVVGHTTRRDGRLQVRCGGRLAVVDIGISRGYGGHLGALEIRGRDARAVYPSGPVDLEDPP